MKNNNVRRLTTLGVLCAVSVMLVALIHFPIFPAVSFLEYDPADIPILIGTFLFGPVWGLVLTLVTCVIQGLTVSAQSGFYGIAMHFFAVGTHIIISGLIYNHNKTKKTALISIIFGTLGATLVMIPANLMLTPTYLSAFGMDISAAKATVNSLLPFIILFNLTKYSINGVITYLVYKKIHFFLKKINLA